MKCPVCKQELAVGKDSRGIFAECFACDFTFYYKG